MRLKARLRALARNAWIDHADARFHFIHIPKNAGESVRDALFFRKDVSLSKPVHHHCVDTEVCRDDIAHFGFISDDSKTRNTVSPQ